VAERLQLLKNNSKLVEAQRLEQRTMFDLEMIREIGYCSGIENYSRYLSGREVGEPPPCLYDYLPPDALLVIDESHQTVPQLGAMYKGDRSRKETLVEYGFRLPSALDNRPLRFEEWERLAPQMIFCSATPGKYEHRVSSQTVEQVARPTGLLDPRSSCGRHGTQVDDLLSEIRSCVQQQQRVLVTTLTKRMAEDLTEYLEEHGVRVRYLHSDIETVERVEIIRDLRWACSTCWWASTYCVRAWTCPKWRWWRCSMPTRRLPPFGGFADPDHGPRGAQHRGRAILYADAITGSMQRAMDETARRRAKQLAFNQAHDITPRTVVKPGNRYHGRRAGGIPAELRARRPGQGQDGCAGGSARNLTEINREIKRLEERMYTAARNLEFEQAAVYRDQVDALRQLELDLANAPAAQPAEGT